MTDPLAVPAPIAPVAVPRDPSLGSAVVPAVVAAAGDRAARRFLEFFAATIRNPNTRAAYHRAVLRFFAWCERHSLDELALIEPLHVAAYVEQLGRAFEKPTVKQHLAAVRMLFDWLVTGGVLAVNPAAPVRGPKHVVKRGRTPVLTPDEARRLLDSIDVSTVVGLRDRALIALMTYTFARIGAAVGMRVEDYYPEGKRWWVRLHEKGGKEHAMPAHHNLEAWLDVSLPWLDGHLRKVGSTRTGSGRWRRSASGGGSPPSTRPRRSSGSRRAARPCSRWRPSSASTPTSSGRGATSVWRPAPPRPWPDRRPKQRSWPG